jgi:transposase
MARGNRKLTNEQVDEIRCLERKRAHYAGLANVYKRENIAKKYGVSYSVITSIVDGFAYKDVPDKWCDEESK